MYAHHPTLQDSDPFLRPYVYALQTTGVRIIAFLLLPRERDVSFLIKTKKRIIVYAHRIQYTILCIVIYIRENVGI